MQYSTRTGAILQPTREIGRGGEGIVWELQGKPGMVLKIYNEPLAAAQLSKLTLMASLNNAAIEALAAWPNAVAYNDKNTACGFTMRRLNGYLPLHMVFSPLERKKLFPDKGYNFLIHIARNLATAFHKLHEAGIVAGDVNEGNILLNVNGFVSFIDCDSFQVKENNTYYYCDVGIPRYTAPELLRHGTFTNVVRTINTDSFSLAILLFQLLFLGRHPFAGVNNTNRDYNEETAIREHEFAYSTTKKRRILYPAPNSIDIAIFPEQLQQLFHRAFETEERPTPAQWISALDELLTSLTICNNTPLHTYPAKAGKCPWCAFRDEKGITYFRDDDYTRYDNAGDYDIDKFINGYNPADFDLQEWSYPIQGAFNIQPQVSKLVLQVVQKTKRSKKYYSNW